MTLKLAATAAAVLAGSTALVAAGPIEDYIAGLLTSGYSVEVEAHNDAIAVLEVEQGKAERIVVLAADGTVLLDMPEMDDDDDDHHDGDDD